MDASPRQLQPTRPSRRSSRCAAGMHTGPQERALTMAFTTFVLFQLFNVFNARGENGTAFNAHFFDNRTLWVSLIGAGDVPPPVEP